MQPYKILFADDNPANLKATKEFLESMGYQVITAQAPQEAIDLVQADEYALVLLDYKMPLMRGDILAKMIKELIPHQQIAMYSCDLSRDAVKTSMRAGAADFIEKSEEPTELLAQIQFFCHRYDHLLRTVRAPNDENANQRLIKSVSMVGQSPVMVKLAASIHKIAPAGDTTVLIRGESGSGKELVAKAIHNLSPRAGGPFVAINCAAIPHDLLESELFGHVKGAFTGAVADKVGQFTLASGGTIFLDEIGDMPIMLQAKLLRVIQERKINVVGGKRPQDINVRIISATHRSLEEMVKEGTFREDLMYRINGVEIDVPPLRHRPEDIPLLIAHFTENCRPKGVPTARRFQTRAMEVLKKYSWPGNVRELAAAVERHLIICPKLLILPEDLDPKYYSTPTTVEFGLNLEAFEIAQADEFISFLE